MGIAAAIARSLESGSTFTRELFAEDHWDADRVAEFVNERRNATIATVSDSGQPHAGVVITASVDDEIYFTVNTRSVLYRNLGNNDRIAVSVCDRKHSAMAQGRAVYVGSARNLTDLVDRLASATSAGVFTPPGADVDIYRIDLRRPVAS